MAKEGIIIVDKKDREVGIGDKIMVHRAGLLHRAFSIFIFNSKKEILLQQRAKTKYHSSGLWSNTCCSHPRPNRNLGREAKRRLKEEMGINCDLKEIFSLLYKVRVGDLIEHEFNHVFLGGFDSNPKPNKEEAEDWKWMRLKELQKDIKDNPQKYTAWLKIILDKMLKTKL